MTERNIIERAFELAGECGSVAELERRLSREGYSQVKAHLEGRQIRREIASRLNRNPDHRAAQSASSPQAGR